MGQLNNKIALVTGGASGLGASIGKRLAAEGAKVVITDIQDYAGKAVANDLDGEFINHDVTSEEQWGDVIHRVENTFGGLHILVNNAGITGSMNSVSPESTTLSDWRKVQQINADGVFLGCRAAIPALRRSGGGAIVNISSIAALIPMPDAMAYGASKATVSHITRSVALHCAQDGSKIRCNSVHPGNVLTPMVQKAMEGIAVRRGVLYEQVVEEFKSENPHGDFLSPEDISSVVLFLVSEESKAVTGSMLVVDGGAMLLRS